MIISIYGAGYVGLVSAVCFAKLGHQVTCCDIDKNKIDALNQGITYLYEKNLPDLLKEQLANKRLAFTHNLSDAVKFSTLHIIATGTPSLKNGQADLSQVFNVVKKIVEETTKDCVIVIKSTVPVGTGNEVEDFIKDLLNKHTKNLQISVVSNPEFLREGNAVEDFLKPERIIVGGDNEALLALKHLYQPLTIKEIPIITMSRTSAELCKYAANVFLASKISFINVISQMAEKTGANIDEICSGLKLDKRIGEHFLNAGLGFGGSCFPKDVKALIQTSKKLGIDHKFFEGIESINDHQKTWTIRKLNEHFNGNIQGLNIGVWGIAFKPETDDIRKASSLVLLDYLLEQKSNIYAYDPKAMENTKTIYKDKTNLTFSDSPEQVLENKLDALIIVTEWEIFKNFSADSLKFYLGDAPVFDGRNCFNLEIIKSSNLSYYYSIGRPTVKNTN